MRSKAKINASKADLAARHKERLQTLKLALLKAKTPERVQNLRAEIERREKEISQIIEELNQCLR